MCVIQHTIAMPYTHSDDDDDDEGDIDNANAASNTRQKATTHNDKQK